MFYIQISGNEAIFLKFYSNKRNKSHHPYSLSLSKSDPYDPMKVCRLISNYSPTNLKRRPQTKGPIYESSRKLPNQSVKC